DPGRGARRRRGARRGRRGRRPGPAPRAVLLGPRARLRAPRRGAHPRHQRGAAQLGADHGQRGVHPVLPHRRHRERGRRRRRGHLHREHPHRRSGADRDLPRREGAGAERVRPRRDRLAAVATPGIAGRVGTLM
ncbi:MAG: Alternative dihydrofolate reductase 3, partial [uncultured Nocardioidaceae bacterium]